MTATWVGSAWSCTVRLVVTDDRALTAAAADLRGLLARVDTAASRFREDSALSRANALAGRPTPIPKLLVELVGAALDAASHTSGAVDPTVGLALRRIGYDRDIAAIRGRDIAGADVGPPSRGRDWRSVRLHRGIGLLTVPLGTSLDLGATAKAWTADHAARTLAARHRTGVLVELGGDLASGGQVPGGWRIRVAERAGTDGQVILVRRGGVATSTSTARTWRRGCHTMHHIVDPATGLPTAGPWRTASVAARSALVANMASTAALIRADALDWLTGHGYAARLVAQDGSVTLTPGWPSQNDGHHDQPFLRDGLPAAGATAAQAELIGTGAGG